MLFEKKLCAHDKKRLYLPKEIADSLGQLTNGQAKVVFLKDVYYEMIGVTRRNNDTIVELAEGWPAFVKRHKLQVGKVYTIAATVGHGYITLAEKGGTFAWKTFPRPAPTQGPQGPNDYKTDVTTAKTGCSKKQKDRVIPSGAGEISGNGLGAAVSNCSCQLDEDYLQYLEYLTGKSVNRCFNDAHCSSYK